MKISNTRYQIRKEIKQLSRIDASKISMPYLTSKVDHLLKGMWTPWFGGPFYEVWRARSGSYNNISELWSPPAKYVSKRGRMNDVNESIFYSCFGHNARLGSLEEIRTEVGDIVTQLCCKLDPEDKILKVLSLGHADLWMKEKAPEHMKNYFINAEAQYKKDCGTEEQYSRSLMLKDWVNDKFIEKIEDGQEYKYAHAVAISKAFFTGFGCEGILYPSVASNAKAVNLVLKPSVAKTHLKPNYARVVEIVSKSSQGIELRLKNESKSISSDGTINWSW